MMLQKRNKKGTLQTRNMKKGTSRILPGEGNAHLGFSLVIGFL
jgi:hypothetical protein